MNKPRYGYTCVHAVNGSRHAHQRRTTGPSRMAPTLIKPLGTNFTAFFTRFTITYGPVVGVRMGNRSRDWVSQQKGDTHGEVVVFFRSRVRIQQQIELVLERIAANRNTCIPYATTSLVVVPLRTCFKRRASASTQSGSCVSTWVRTNMK